MSEPGLVDITGRLRSPAATPGHSAGLAPPNKGLRYPPDPPTVGEIILVMRQAGRGRYADRTRGLIAMLWRAGLRISEALALTEPDLDPKTGSVLVRLGKGGNRRMVGMDDWGWEHVARWVEHRGVRCWGRNANTSAETTSSGSLPTTSKNTFKSYAVASQVFIAPRAPTNSKYASTNRCPSVIDRNSGPSITRCILGAKLIAQLLPQDDRTERNH